MKINHEYCASLSLNGILQPAFILQTSRKVSALQLSDLCNREFVKSRPAEGIVVVHMISYLGAFAVGEVDLIE